MTRKRQQAGSYQKWGKTHYEKNKADYIARAAATKEKNRRAFAEFKATLSCIICGESHPATLDFHHVIKAPSNKKVYRLAGAGQLKKAMDEIKKCVVLCANCHRLSHFLENHGRSEDVHILQEYFAHLLVPNRQKAEIRDRISVQRMLTEKSLELAEQKHRKGP